MGLAARFTRLPQVGKQPAAPMDGQSPPSYGTRIGCELAACYEVIRPPRHPVLVFWLCAQDSLHRSYDEAVSGRGSPPTASGFHVVHTAGRGCR